MLAYSSSDMSKSFSGQNLVIDGGREAILILVTVVSSVSLNFSLNR